MAAGAVPAACVCRGLAWRGAAEAFCVGRASLLPRLRRLPPHGSAALASRVAVARPRVGLVSPRSGMGALTGSFPGTFLPRVIKSLAVMIPDR